MSGKIKPPKFFPDQASKFTMLIRATLANYTVKMMRLNQDIALFIKEMKDIIKMSDEMKKAVQTFKSSVNFYFYFSKEKNLGRKF